MKKHGQFEELQIFYHPKTNKHLGLARVVFEHVKNAKSCVEKLNQTSVMGRPLQVFLDPFGNVTNTIIIFLSCLTTFEIENFRCGVQKTV